MTPKEYLDIAKDTIAAVEADLLDPVTGQFKANLAGAGEVVQAVSASYLAHGGVESPDVEKIVVGIGAALAIASTLTQ
jgi:hypothetical protein